jgi:hypothetical protein
VVTPLGALFWSLFNTDDCGAFFWGPHANSLTYFSIPGLLLMVPAIFIYNLMVSEVDPLEKFLKKLVGLRGGLSIQADKEEKTAILSDGSDSDIM